MVIETDENLVLSYLQHCQERVQERRNARSCISMPSCRSRVCTVLRIQASWSEHRVGAQDRHTRRLHRAPIEKMSSLRRNTARKESDTMNGTQNQSQSGSIGGVSGQGKLRKIKCNYCQKIFSGSVYRIKHHLAGTKKDVSAYENVSPEVRKQMWDIVVGLQANLMRKTISVEERATKDDDDIMTMMKTWKRSQILRWVKKGKGGNQRYLQLFSRRRPHKLPLIAF
ncbi:hypothetical protein PIB30_076752 [Stylosanthes scabra]|uniref:BED-type domain-containing protein n=1 Tax=Stylosanthes scabra TaxID=79078 RepID=A0ABU6WQ09_9FABA|nr:hypothetical protein [Stylosanthes scabra]